MFKSLRDLINTRLGSHIVIDDFNEDLRYFIKIKPENLYSLMFFLKHDPDLKLNVLDDIFSLPCGTLIWPILKTDFDLELIYDLKSLKLPYRVSIAVPMRYRDALPSIASLFMGARFLEADLKQAYSFTFEERGR